MFRTAASRSARRAADLWRGGAALCATAARPALVGAAQASTGASAGAAGALLATAAAATFAAGSVFASSDERSFIMVKPDGVQRGMVAEIIRRFEAKGYKLVGIKVIVPTKDLAGRHYDEHKERPFFPKLVNFLSSGPVVAMVWEGKEVVKYGRTMIGVTNPLASVPGTIRGDFGIDVGRNIIHGSDSVESAQREMALWFLPHELADYEFANKAWLYE